MKINITLQRVEGITSVGIIIIEDKNKTNEIETLQLAFNRASSRTEKDKNKFSDFLKKY